MSNRFDHEAATREVRQWFDEGEFGSPKFVEFVKPFADDVVGTAVDMLSRVHAVHLGSLASPVVLMTYPDNLSGDDMIPQELAFKGVLHHYGLLAAYKDPEGFQDAEHAKLATYTAGEHGSSWSLRLRRPDGYGFFLASYHRGEPPKEGKWPVGTQTNIYARGD